MDSSSPNIITGGIRGAIHTPTINQLQDLHIPIPKIHKIMKQFSQIIIIYLTHIILNKIELKKN